MTQFHYCHKNYIQIFLMLLCSIPMTGCSSESDNEKAALSIVGTCQCLGPDKPPLSGEWGPMWETFVLHESGKIEWIWSDETNPLERLPEDMYHREIGTYKITANTFETNIANEKTTSQYTLDQDRLILRNESGVISEFIRMKH